MIVSMWRKCYHDALYDAHVAQEMLAEAFLRSKGGHINISAADERR